MAMNRRPFHFRVCREADLGTLPDDKNGDGENDRPVAGSNSPVSINKLLPSTFFPAEMGQGPRRLDPGETVSSVFPPHFNGL